MCLEFFLFIKELLNSKFLPVHSYFRYYEDWCLFYELIIWLLKTNWCNVVCYLTCILKANILWYTHLYSCNNASWGVKLLARWLTLLILLQRGKWQTLWSVSVTRQLSDLSFPCQCNDPVFVTALFLQADHLYTLSMYFYIGFSQKYTLLILDWWIWHCIPFSVLLIFIFSDNNH